MHARKIYGIFFHLVDREKKGESYLARQNLEGNEDKKLGLGGRLCRGKKKKKRLNRYRKKRIRLIKNCDRWLLIEIRWNN